MGDHRQGKRPTHPRPARGHRSVHGLTIFLSYKASLWQHEAMFSKAARVQRKALMVSVNIVNIRGFAGR
jgi:hypothetical protein